MVVIILLVDVSKLGRNITVISLTKTMSCVDVTDLYIEIVKNSVEFFTLGGYNMVVGAADLVRAWSSVIQRQFAINDDGIAIDVMAVRVGTTIPQSNGYLGDAFPVLYKVLERITTTCDCSTASETYHDCRQNRALTTAV